jgi:phosphoglycolate phosphatase-like HAD superfamily hydrolase
MSQLRQAFEILDAVTQTDLTTTPASAVHGIAEALLNTSDAGATHTVLTGNTPGRARIKVTSAGLQTRINLGIGYFGHVHDDRFGLVAAAATTLSANGQRAVIVGDTPLDIQAARAAGLPVIAVATGIVAADELAEHEPDALFEVLDGHHDAFTHAITEVLM